MASTPFKVISWSPEQPITKDKLDAMVSNDNWLRDNMIRARYATIGDSRETGVRMLSGLATVRSSKSASRTVNVNFGSFFSQSCKPVVTTGIVSKTQRQIFVTIDGPGSKPMPTRDGFQIHVMIGSNNKKKKIKRDFFVSYLVMGF